MNPTWVEIDAAALRANIAAIKARLAPGSRMAAVVKSNAYGHGLTPCAELLLEAGCDWLVVNTLDEAEDLRRLGLEAPVYICGPVFAEQAPRLAATGARAVLYDGETARAIQEAAVAAGVRVKVHLKVETGTNRQGLSISAAIDLGFFIQGLSHVKIEGLTTHFADIEDSTDHRFAQEQLEALLQARRAFAEAGIAVPMAHAANSAAALLWPETHLDMVRVGIAAYGLWPSRETYATALQRAGDRGESMAQLQPVMAWKARIAQVKEVPAGEYIGYGRTFRATHPLRLAVLPVGYYEGYDRRLSNIGHVLVNGVRAPVRGRVCMNMFMVDISDIPVVEVGAVATLLGRDGDEAVDASMWAGWMGSIHYEAVSGVLGAIPRLLSTPPKEESTL